jgi:parallel beta-helix repeat protein
LIKNVAIYIFLLSMFLISLEAAAATNISVHPGDSIQSAVNKASDGDTIIVYAYKNASYTYKGNVVLNKKLFIRSSGSVTIQAKNTKSAVFTVNSKGAGSSIKNFKLSKSSYCVVINNANNCLISGNTITEASLVGIQFYGNIYNNTVANNKIYGQNPRIGNGISFEYGNATYNNISTNTIGNFLNGILFNSASSSNLVHKNRIKCTNHNGVGIYATDASSDMQIISNTITGAEDGIAIQQIGKGSAKNYLVKSNTANYNKNGFWIRLFNSIIDSNQAHYNTVSGLDITGKYNKISRNSASYNSNCGITLSRYSSNDHNYVYKNYLGNNNAGINSASHGTTLVYNKVMGNTNNGIISKMNYANITSNQIENNKGSGMLTYGKYCTINSNYIRNNLLGIFVRKYCEADHNSLSYNTILKNKNGINSASTLSIISFNNIYNNRQTGLTITGSKSYIYKNLLNSNGEAGLTITGKYNVVTQNSICKNLYGASFNNGVAAVVNYNRIVGNKYQMYICKTSTALNALNNWWGSNKSPSAILGNINAKKWIVLRLTSIKKLDNGYYNVTADLCRNSAGEILSNGYIKDGTIINFYTSQGHIGPSAKTVKGIAVTILSPSKGVGAGSLKISASLDNQTVTKLLYC